VGPRERSGHDTRMCTCMIGHDTSTCSCMIQAPQTLVIEAPERLAIQAPQPLALLFNSLTGSSEQVYRDKCREHVFKDRMSLKTACACSDMQRYVVPHELWCLWSC